jgi:hypothetical protein
MENKQLTTTTPGELAESVLIEGDLAKLNPEQRLLYYKAVCESVGLNPLTKPFEYINLNGKLTLYARKDATDQLRKIHGVAVTETKESQLGDLFIVTARGQDKHGRIDTAKGAVSIQGLNGERLANALMKCETKAKRRLTLSLCGLGLLDESEIEGAKVEAVYQAEMEALPQERVEEWWYDLEDIEPDKRQAAERYLEDNGAVHKDTLMMWCAPKELKKLVKYLVDAPLKEEKREEDAQ